MNTKGYKTKLEERIKLIPAGKTFVANDFSDIASSRTIRELIRRMIGQGDITRVLPGVYMRPLISELLDEQVPADPEDVAYSIARANNWRIAPSGNTALNKLGLSPQVPMAWTFVSDGPYTEKNVYGIPIVFKNVANRNISGMSPVTLLVVQALKALGRDNVDELILHKISEQLNEEDLKAILRETERSTVWLRDAIMKIACKRSLAC